MAFMEIELWHCCYRPIIIELCLSNRFFVGETKFSQHFIVAKGAPGNTDVCTHTVDTHIQMRLISIFNATLFHLHHFLAAQQKKCRRLMPSKPRCRYQAIVQSTNAENKALNEQNTEKTNGSYLIFGFVCKLMNGQKKIYNSYRIFIAILMILHHFAFGNILFFWCIGYASAVFNFYENKCEKTQRGDVEKPRMAIQWALHFA